MKSKEAHDMGINSKKGKPSSQNWEMDVSRSVFPRGEGDHPAGAFLPRPGKDRAQPLAKINECDH